MKKLAMLTVKGAVGLLPPAVKRSLKTNARLTEFYSRSLQRSGLFYGFPSAKKLQALYSQRLTEQQQQLSQYVATPQHCNIFLAGTVRDEIIGSLESLDQSHLQVEHVYVDDSIALNDQVLLDTGFRFAHLSSCRVEHLTQMLCLRAGDKVNTHLLRLALAKAECSNARILYFDWHYLDKNNKPVDAQLLPDWNPDYQYSTGYVKTAIWIRQANRVLTQNPLHNLRDGFAGLLARIAVTGKQDIEHVPFSVMGSKCKQASDKVALENVASAVKDIAAPSINKKTGVISQMWPLPFTPLVSLIIPTYNAKELVKACIDSILEKTTYQNYEILLVDNNSNDPACLRYFDELNNHPKIRLLRYPHPFNYSAINNFAVKYARGEVIGLVNNDIEVITPEWLEYMAGHAMRDDIGCVGAKLLFTDGRIQHAGVVMGYGGGAGHAHKYFPRYHPGYMNRLIATQNYSAVTAACLLVKKSKFEEVGGLNEEDLQVAFNDVDFCLRVVETGVRNLYCAEAELYHHESVSRGLDISPEKAARFNRELTYLQTTWKKYIAHDPAYNPNLTLRRENFAIKGKNEN